MKTRLNCILCQCDIEWNKPQENLDRYESFIRKAPPDSDLIIFPEMCLTGFVMDNDIRSFDPHGEEIERFTQMAAKYKIGIIAGLSVLENGKRYNRMQYFSPDGMSWHYDKQHLFRMGDEHLYYNAGNALDDLSPFCKNFHCEGWNIHPQICYDLRFPESCRNHYRDGLFDYDCLLVIANWPQSRNAALRILAKARAIENQSYVIVVNRIGFDAKGVYHGGNSMVIDYKGNIINELPDEKEGMLETVLSYGPLQDFREAFPSYMDWNS